MTEQSFWPGWTLGTLADFATIGIAVFAVAYAIWRWGAFWIVRAANRASWRKKDSGSWPIKISYSEATRQPISTQNLPEGRLIRSIQVTVLLKARPRWGAWTPRNPPRLERAVVVDAEGELHPSEMFDSWTADIERMRTVRVRFPITTIDSRGRAIGKLVSGNPWKVRMDAHLNPYPDEYIWSGEFDMEPATVSNNQ